MIFEDIMRALRGFLFDYAPEPNTCLWFFGPGEKISTQRGRRRLKNPIFCRASSAHSKSTGDLNATELHRHSFMMKTIYDFVSLTSTVNVEGLRSMTRGSTAEVTRSRGSLQHGQVFLPAAFGAL